MAYDTIQTHQTVTSTVASDGSPAEKIELSEPRWNCVDPRCALSFGSWDDVVEHCAVYHRDPLPPAAVE